LGLLLLGAVFGYLAAALTWLFVIATGICFLLGFTIERGVLTRKRISDALPFEVRWRVREPKNVSVAAPLGVLDWELAFERYGQGIRRSLEEVARRMTAVTAVMQAYTPRFEAAKEAPTKTKVDLSREFAKKVRPHAKGMEQAERDARRAIEGFSENYLKRIAAFPPDLDLAEIRPSVAGLLEATSESLTGMRAYRDAVQSARAQNLQQAMNEVLDQLLDTANKLVDDTETAGTLASEGLAEIDGRASTTGINRAERRRALRRAK
jgi:hypothetical protein